MVYFLALKKLEIPHPIAKVPGLEPCPFGQSFFRRLAIFSELLKNASGRTQ